jgi:hypothetical protein
MKNRLVIKICLSLFCLFMFFAFYKISLLDNVPNILITISKTARFVLMPTIMYHLAGAIGICMKDLPNPPGLVQEIFDPANDEDYIIIKVPTGKPNDFTRINVLKTNVSEKVEECLIKINESLNKLYESAMLTEKSQQTFAAYNDYFQIMADEIKNAVNDISGDATEDKFLQNINVVYDFIKKLQQNINDDIQYVRDQAFFEEQLNAESYEPFAILREANKLM